MWESILFVQNTVTKLKMSLVDYRYFNELSFFGAIKLTVSNCGFLGSYSMF